MRPTTDDDVTEILRREGYRGGRFQTLLSVPGTIGVLSSVLLAVTGGFVAAALSGDSLWAATLVGLAAFAIAVPLHQRYQMQARLRAHEAFAEHGFPTAEA